MHYHRLFWRLTRLASVFAFSFACAAVPGWSDVVGNGTGTDLSLSVGDDFIISGGTPSGGNLFHSFSDFDLTSAQTATFQNFGAVDINNVIGRIDSSGDAGTEINGSVSFNLDSGSRLTGANLFLFDPLGMAFGSTASINVPGSFHASSANHIIFEGGGIWGLNNAGAPTGALTVAAPTGFGFLSGNANNLLAGNVDITVGTDESISLVGSGLELNGGLLVANSGRINLASVNSSAGGADVTNLTPGSDALEITGTSGNIVATNTRIDVSGLSSAASGDPNGAGGDVYIVGGDLTLNGTTITSELFSNALSGNININGSGLVTLNNADINTGHDQGTFIDEIVVAPITIGFPPFQFTIPGFTIPAVSIAPIIKGTGNAGDVNITGDKVLVTNGSSIFSSTEFISGVTSGDSGSVTIRSTNQDNVVATTDAMTGEVIDTAFEVFIATPTSADVIIDGSNIFTQASGGGRSGNININAGLTGGFFGGFFNLFPVPINVDTLYINNSDIRTINASGGDADMGSTAGSIIFNASNALIDNSTQLHSDTTGSGNAGFVGLRGSEWLVRNTSTITSSTTSTGNAGSISIAVTDFTLDNSMVSSSSTAATPNAAVTGNAGNIVVTNCATLFCLAFATSTESFILQNGAKVISSTATTEMGTGELLTPNAGDAGQITINTEELSVSGAGTEINTSTINGAGGNIDIRLITNDPPVLAGDPPPPAPTGLVSNGGRILSNTVGNGDAGKITVTGGELTIDGTTVASQIQSSQTSNGTGDAGDIEISVAKLEVTGDSRIDSSTASSSVSSDAGSITITANDGVIATDLASAATTDADFILSTTLVITGFNTITIPGIFGGPPIIISVPIFGSATPTISSDASNGMGNAGGITINAESGFVQGGQIFANTNTGLGGSITINADQFAGFSAQIQANTNGGQKAGDINFNSLTAGLPIADWLLTDSNVFSDALDSSAGAAGDISININSLMLNNSVLSTSTGDNTTGNAGDITVTTVTSLDVSNGSIIASSTGTSSTGSAGSIDLTSVDIDIDGASSITSNSNSGAGAAGDIDITAETFTLDGAAITSITQDGFNTDTSSIELASITIIATILGEILNDNISAAPTLISTSTTGAGQAGLISLTGGEWRISGDADESTDTTTAPNNLVSDLIGSTVIQSTTSSADSDGGDAGSISIIADIAITISDYALVTSSARGGSIGNAGEVVLTTDTSGAVTNDNIMVLGGAEISSNATNMGATGAAGAVDITTDNFTIDGGSISTNTNAGIDSTGGSQIGNVTITTVTGVIKNTAAADNGSQTEIAANTIGNGQAGAVTLVADNWTITGDAIADVGVIDPMRSTRITSSTQGNGSAGLVSITANNQLSIGDYALVATSSAPAVVGNAGQIDLLAGTNIEIDSNAKIASTTGAGATGNAGNIRVLADTDIVIDSNAIVTSSIGTASSGNAGNIRISTETDGTDTTGDSISIMGGASILSSSEDGVNNMTMKGGNAGSIDIETDVFSIIDNSEINTTNNAGTVVGDSETNGVISITANQTGVINTTTSSGDAAEIKSNTVGNGDAGAVGIFGGDWIINGTTGFVYPDYQAQISTNQMGNFIGDAGDILVDVNSLSMQRRGKIESSTGSTALGMMGQVSDAGSITIIADDGIDDAGTNDFEMSGGIAQIYSNSTGNGSAGDIDITAGTLELITADIFAQNNDGAGGIVTLTSDHGTVSAVTFIQTDTSGIGTAGSINILGGDWLFNSSGNRVTSTALNGSSGSAGDINFDVVDLMLADGLFSASTEASTTGNAGDIDIVASNSVNINGTATLASSSGATGEAGFISIAAPSFTLDSSSIATTANNGTMGLGLITIDSPITQITNSSIIASTNGTDNAGNIIINSLTSLTIDSGSLLSSSSVSGLGEAGGIQLTTPLFLLDNSRIATTNDAGPLGIGDILITATTASITNNSLVEADTTGEGAAGSITIISDTLSVMADSELSSGSTYAGVTAGLGAAGDIDITTNSLTLNSSEITTETINGEGGNIDIDTAIGIIANASDVTADTEGDGDAGTITINATTSLDITGGMLTPSVVSSNSADGSNGAEAGSVTITTPSLTLNRGSITTTTSSGSGAMGFGSILITAPVITATSNSTIQADSVGTGNAGSVTLIADTSLNLNSGSVISSDSTSGIGEAGTIDITTALLSLNFAQISTRNAEGILGLGSILIDAATMMFSSSSSIAADTSGMGAAGNITLNASNMLTVNSSSSISSDSSFGSGEAGTVTITTPILSLDDGRITTATNLGAAGLGSINVTAPVVAVENNSVISADNVGGAGNAGNVSVIASTSLDVNSGSTISSNSNAGLGNAGSVSLTTADLDIDNATIATVNRNGATPATITIDATSGVATATFSNNAQVTASTVGTGPAGDILITAGDILVQTNSAISSSSEMATGSAGSISMEAGDITIDGANVRTVNNAGIDQANIILNATNASTGIITNGAVVTASTVGAGNAGSVSLLGPNWIVSGTSTQVTSSTTGDGDAGQITATTGNFLLDAATVSTNSSSAGDSGAILINSGLITLTNGGTVQSNVSGTGDGGVITLTSSSDVFLSNGAEVSTNTTPNAAPIIEGDAGNIFVNAVGTLNMVSSLLTSSTTSDGEAGTVTIATGESVYLLDSTILVDSTGATSAGVGGGNLDVTTGILVLDSSTLDASAGSGTGGNVSITADFFFISPDSVIDVSSGTGASGTLSVNAVAVDLSGSLNALKVKFKDGGKLLRQACSTKGAASNSSSFIVENGIEGIPSSPVDFQSASTLDVIVAPEDLDTSSNQPAAISPAGAALFASIACSGF